jgi:hypothetical protein
LWGQNLDSVNVAQAEALKPLLNVLARGGNALTGSKIGRKFSGMLAAPLKKVNLEDLSAYKSISKDKKAEAKKSSLDKIRDAVINKFAFGDLMSLAGLAFYALQKKIGPEKPGVINSLMQNAALAMTFLGSTTAAFGRTFGHDMEYVYGDQHGLYMLKEAESRGKTIFTLYNDVPGKIDDLIKGLAKSKKYLVYKKGLDETIKFRHEQVSKGGLLDGPQGTGKTEAARHIMAETANQIRLEGNEPVIAELNLANFSDYIDQKMSDQRDLVDLAKKFYGNDPNGSFINNQGIMVLEALISQIRDIRKQVDDYNIAHSSGPQKKLIIFVDEFDKALQTRTLKGCDKSRLRNLLIQFNEVFVKEDILLTSNTKLEKMRESLAEHVKVDDADTGEAEVIAPMFDRLSAKNRAFIDFPDSPEQALIIAGRLLTDYPKNIDWRDFSLDELKSGSYDFDRRRLAEVIEREITAKLQTKINGRQLASACDQLISLLVGKATNINAEKGLFDDKAWSQMKSDEKIASTGTKIDREMVMQVVSSKLQNMNLNQSQKDFDFSFKLISSYLNSNPISKQLKEKQVKLATSSGKALEDTLSLVYDKRANDPNTVYVARDLIEFAGKKYQHVVTQYPGVEGANSSYSIAFADVSAKPVEKLTMYDFVSTKRVSAPRFAEEIVPMINRSAENTLLKAVDSILGAFTKGGASINLKDEDIKTVAEAAVKNLLAA